MGWRKAVIERQRSVPAKAAMRASASTGSTVEYGAVALVLTSLKVACGRKFATVPGLLYIAQPALSGPSEYL